MVLVVLLHACVAYMVVPLPTLLWPVQEPPANGSWGADALFHTARALGVPMVSVVAGIMSVGMLQRRGRRSFLWERWKRLGRPLVLGIPCVLVPMYLIWAWGWVLRGWAAPEHILHVRFGPAVQPHLHGLAHLWFLQYMLLYALLLSLAWPWLARVPKLHAGRAIVGACSHPLVAPLALATLLTPVLVRWPTSVLGFHNGFIPEPGQFIKHGLLLLAGGAIGLSMQGPTPRTLRDRTSYWWVFLPLAILACWVMLGALRADMKPKGEALLLLAATSSLTMVAGVWAILGILVRVAPGLSAMAQRGLRSLADASVWVYLFHLVPQGVCVVLLYRSSLPNEVKLLLVFCAGLVVPLVVSRVLRRNRAGTLLGMPTTKQDQLRQ